MQTNMQTKNALARGGVRCPKCSGEARAVPNGVFCRADGFVEDPATWLYPTPDEISTKLRADPERQAANERMEAARLAYEAARDGWLRILSELNTVRVQAQNDPGSWDAGGAGWRPSKKVNGLRKREAALLDALEPASRAKDRAEEAFSLARQEFYELNATVSARLGRPVMRVNERASIRTTLIPAV